MSSHPCPGCGYGILDSRWCCAACYKVLSDSVKAGIRRRFSGSAEDHINAVKQGLDELAKAVTK